MHFNLQPGAPLRRVRGTPPASLPSLLLRAPPPPAPDPLLPEGGDAGGGVRNSISPLSTFPIHFYSVCPALSPSIALSAHSRLSLSLLHARFLGLFPGTEPPAASFPRVRGPPPARLASPPRLPASCPAPPPAAPPAANQRAASHGPAPRPFREGPAEPRPRCGGRRRGAGADGVWRPRGAGAGLACTRERGAVKA